MNWLSFNQFWIFLHWLKPENLPHRVLAFYWSWEQLNIPRNGIFRNHVSKKINTYFARTSLNNRLFLNSKCLKYFCLLQLNFPKVNEVLERFTACFRFYPKYKNIENDPGLVKLCPNNVLFGIPWIYGVFWRKTIFPTYSLVVQMLSESWLKFFYSRRKFETFFTSVKIVFVLKEQIRE